MTLQVSIAVKIENKTQAEPISLASFDNGCRSVLTLLIHRSIALLISSAKGIKSHDKQRIKDSNLELPR